MAVTTPLGEKIEASLLEVQARIAMASARAGRSPSSVRLIAVSKTHSPEAIRAAHAAGQRDFGESYVQELIKKAEALADLDGVRWRLVGHLQRNKAKDVIAVGAAVDSVDSVRLGEALARRAEAAARRTEVLVQVNVGREPQKSGCAPEDVGALVAALRAMPALDVRGLMTVPPHTDDPEGARPFFRELRALAAREGLPELSMGMTHDLEIAVEEGATMVRVGTAIFGPR